MKFIDYLRSSPEEDKKRNKKIEKEFKHSVKRTQENPIMSPKRKKQPVWVAYHMQKPLGPFVDRVVGKEMPTGVPADKDDIPINPKSKGKQSAKKSWQQKIGQAIGHIRDKYTEHKRHTKVVSGIKQKLKDQYGDENQEYERFVQTDWRMKGRYKKHPDEFFSQYYDDDMNEGYKEKATRVANKADDHMIYVGQDYTSHIGRMLRAKDEMERTGKTTVDTTNLRNDLNRSRNRVNRWGDLVDVLRIRARKAK